MTRGSSSLTAEMEELTAAATDGLAALADALGMQLDDLAPDVAGRGDAGLRLAVVLDQALVELRQVAEVGGRAAARSRARVLAVGWRARRWSRCWPRSTAAAPAT